jgi:hypothetical protein
LSEAARPASGQVGTSPCAPINGAYDLAEVDRLVGDGRLVEAVDLLAAANRREPDPALATRLGDLRHQAACSLDPGPGRSPWPPAFDEHFLHRTCLNHLMTEDRYALEC